MIRSFACRGLLIGLCSLGLVSFRAPEPFAQTGPCSASECENCPDASESVFDTLIALSPCNADPNLAANFKLKYRITVNDENGDPIEDFYNMDLDYYYAGCNTQSAIPPDAPSDEDGLLVWSDNLNQPAHIPTGCGVFVIPYYQQCADTYFVIPGTNIYSWGGFRNMDQTGDTIISLADWSPVQQAFQNQGPAYKGDFTRDKVVSLGDLSLFNAHFQTCGSSDRGTLSQKREKVDQISEALNEEIGFYVHVTDALPEGVQPLPVSAGQAVTSVGSVGASGTRKSVIVFAHGYDGLGGFHIKLNWPAAWEFEGVDAELLPGQLVGYPDDGFHEMKYAAVFDCLSGGAIRAVARFDVLATEPGSVGIDNAAPLQIVNCDLQERTLPVQEDGFAVGQKSERSEPEVTKVVRLDGTVSGEAIGFEVTSEVPQDLAAMVYDVSGRVVRALEKGVVISGTHVVRWDGRTDLGAKAPSGVYLVAIEVGPYRHVERALLMR